MPRSVRCRRCRTGSHPTLTAAVTVATTVGLGSISVSAQSKPIPELCKEHIQASEKLDRIGVCIDGTQRPPTVYRERLVVDPNRTFEVHLYAYAQDLEDWDVRIGGVRGYTPIGEAQVSQTATALTSTVHQKLEFAARRPGPADLLVLVQGEELLKLDFEVQAKLWGAIRFGVATVFGDAANTTYRAISSPPGGTRNVEIENARDFEFELVLGLSAYIVDIIACGGRGTIERCGLLEELPVAPYFGYGLLGDSGAANGIESLQSVHFGIEYELAKFTSVALTGVVRRVEVLREGLQPGAAVPRDDIPLTRTEDRFGFAIVLNVNPGFLSFQNPFGGGQ